MNPNEDPRDNFGLLSTGTSGCWTIDLDESSDGKEWSVQLDGPQLYLTFAVRDLSVIGSAVDYLHSKRNREDALTLGHFESAAVSLYWDNEDSDRCFLIVRPSARSALRVTLSADDIGMLAEALEQILEDLPAEPTK